jgi:pimeloyl-ACP methyl ester carboxylesterase
MGFPFECAIVQVPLNYNDPNGPVIQIAMLRLPASDPSRRIGSLFLNPGGPGGSGVDFARYAAPYIYSDEVRARFDMVGFDPRGVARSTALKCFGNAKQESVIFTPFPFPMNDAEEAIWETADRVLVGSCAQRVSATRLQDHMATAEVARDLDLLRQAVGDEKLTYAGFSYGTYLGVTYANLFPDRVRAVVVDGVLDPIAWSTGAGDGSTVPFSTRLRSDQGAEATLEEFFRLCDDPASFCDFRSAQPSSVRYANLAEKLKANPIVFQTPTGPGYFGYAHLIGLTLGYMYSSFGWPYLAQDLAFLDSVADPATLAPTLSGTAERAGLITKRGVPNYPNIESFFGVACGDSNNPTDYEIWTDTAIAAEQQYGYFGRIWTWNSSVCATWPGPVANRYAGPFTADTANTVLVVGNYFDPATRYQGAEKVASLLPNSRLLSVHGWGHCSLGLSACADATVSSYLVTGVLPAPGTVCSQEIIPLSYSVANVAAVQTVEKKSRARKALIQTTLPAPARGAIPVQ